MSFLLTESGCKSSTNFNTLQTFSTKNSRSTINLTLVCITGIIHIHYIIYYSNGTGLNWCHIPFCNTFLSHGAVFHHNNKWNKSGEWKSLRVLLSNKYRNEFDLTCPLQIWTGFSRPHFMEVRKWNWKGHRRHVQKHGEVSYTGRRPFHQCRWHSCEWRTLR